MTPFLAKVRQKTSEMGDLIAFHTQPRYRLAVPRHMCACRIAKIEPGEDVAEWCDAMMPGRWRIVFTSDLRGAEFHFLHLNDMVLFKLMWAEDIADTRIRVPDDIWPALLRRPRG